ncbi:MAG: hypothetical protein FWH52_06645 [Synergistaceae bacterium]|nr:hypothetical protein [Synergistaceae bacterium]
MRRLGLTPPPSKRRWEIFNSYSLDQVFEILYGYLNGSIHISSKAGNTSILAADEMIESIALIGYRVMLKYCKGETPHPGRMSVWESCLRIADILEADGLLPTCEREAIVIEGYCFHSRIYRTDKIGNIYLPERPGEKVSCDDSNHNILKELSSYQWHVGKKRAANLIRAYSDEVF